MRRLLLALAVSATATLLAAPAAFAGAAEDAFLGKLVGYWRRRAR